MKHEKEIVERQRKQQREEKKKQKLEKLKEQFSFFESEVLTKNLLKELRTCWEVLILTSKFIHTMAKIFKRERIYLEILHTFLYFFIFYILKFFTFE